MTPTARSDDRAASHLSQGLTQALVRGTGGRLYVPQGESVVVLDSGGRYLHSIGRSGAGPGEFRSMTFIALRRDTLFVYDPALRRTSLFRVDGTFIRTESIAPGGKYYGWPYAPLGVTGDGKLLVTMRPLLPEQSWTTTFDGILGLLPRDRGPIRELLSARTTPPVMVLDLAEDRKLNMRTPISEAPLYGVSPGGSQVIAVEVPFPSGRMGAYEVHRFDPKGERLTRTRRPFQAERVTAEGIDSLFAQSVSVLAQGRRSDVDFLMYKMREAYHPPGWYPAFDRLVIGEDAYLWLRDAAHVNRWIVLDSSDAVVAWTQVPGKLLAASYGEAWVMAGEDSLAGPFIVRYKIQK